MAVTEFMHAHGVSTFSTDDRSWAVRGSRTRDPSAVPGDGRGHLPLRAAFRHPARRPAKCSAAPPRYHPSLESQKLSLFSLRAVHAQARRPLSRPDFWLQPPRDRSQSHSGLDINAPTVRPAGRMRQALRVPVAGCIAQRDPVATARPEICGVAVTAISHREFLCHRRARKKQLANMGATARPELSIDRRMVQHAVAEFELSYGHRPQLGAAPSGVGHDVVGGAEWPILAGGARCDAGDPLYRYTGAVGLLVPREDAFDARRTSAVFVGGDVEVSIELPRDLRRLAGWRGSLLDGDRYQHRVALGW